MYDNNHNKSKALAKKFNYVQLNVIATHNQANLNDAGQQKVLLQIIDVNDKILYNEAKAEQSFLTLINAAISHELRNPLNSLIG